MEAIAVSVRAAAPPRGRAHARASRAARASPLEPVPVRARPVAMPSRRGVAVLTAHRATKKDGREC
jgi:hypothetical protein